MYISHGFFIFPITYHNKSFGCNLVEKVIYIASILLPKNHRRSYNNEPLRISLACPIFKNDLIIVASGRRPAKPIFAIRAGATGDITLTDQKTSSEFIAWTRRD